MKILIKNGLVITMDNVIDKLDIVINNDIIEKVCKVYTGKYDKIIDATGKIVMPGLINCHTHLGMSIFRATNDDYTLDKWLNEKIWPIENNMTNEDMYYTTLVSCIEMIKTGTTSFNDMYFCLDGVYEAVSKSGLRGRLSRCLMKGNDFDRIEDAIRLYDKYNGKNELIDFSIGPHALYTTDIEYLKKCNSLADKYHLPVHIHLSENEKEVANTVKTYNKLPIEVLNEVGFLNKKLLLAHGTFISDKELKILDGKDISICTNPVSNLNLGCGIADLSKYKKYNINLCLGTDGQGSGNNMNMFYHMSFVDYLQKAKYTDPTIMSSYDVLKMATIGGAKALGYFNVGMIKEGYKADIIVLNSKDLVSYPYHDIIPHIVHNMWNNNVITTIVNGNILMEDRKLNININEDKLKSKIDEITTRLLKEMK